MLIQGSFHSEHIVREFIEHEYAFSCIWEGGKELRIAHHKGEWFLWKKEKDGRMEDFVFSDDLRIVKIENDLLAGLIDEKRKTAEKRQWDSRKAPAWVLSQVLVFWAGKLDQIVEVNVLQPGRNAIITEDGSFNLRPREEEWKN